MNEEIDLYADVEKVHSNDYYEQKNHSSKSLNKVKKTYFLLGYIKN